MSAAMIGIGATPAAVVTLNRYAVTGTRFDGANVGGTVTTFNSVTASISGGVPPYTIVWEDTGTPGDIYPNSTLSFSTKFFAYFSESDVFTTTYIAKVTDATATTYDSLPVTVTLSYQGGDIV